MNNRFKSILLGAAVFAALLVTGLIVAPKLAHADPSGNIYNLPSFPLQQITGGPGPGTVSQPPFAATMTIGTNSENQGLVQQIVATSTVSSSATVNAGSGGQFGQFLVTIVTAVGGTETITFGTSFLPTATAAPTIGKSITVCWVSDGTNWHEMCRSASAQ